MILVNIDNIPQAGKEGVSPRNPNRQETLLHESLQARPNVSILLTRF